MTKIKLLLLTLLAGCAAGSNEKKEETPKAQPAKTEQTSYSPDFYKAYDLYQKNHDSAFYYFNQVVNQSKDSQEIATAYNFMGLIQRRAGDYTGGEESLLGSIKHLNKNKPADQYSLFSVYTTLGNIYIDLKNYEAALSYYDSALRFSNRKDMLPYSLNGKAVAYQKKHQYEEAIKIYDSIIHLSAHNKKEYARILSNRAMAKWLQNPAYNPLPELWTAMHLRAGENDNWGLNASYAHLCDYYANSRPDSALVYARKMYEVAKQNNSPDDQMEALLKLIKLETAKRSVNWVDIYQRINDSVQSARNTAKNQFALIRYESEKNKAEKLVLEKDVAESKFQIIRQRTAFYSIVVLLIVSAIAGISYYHRRKRRMEEERKNAVREAELKLSRKVHDVVANSLYSIMSKIEYDPEYNIEQLLDQLEILYEKSRDISYEIPNKPVEGFQQTVTNLLTSFANPETKVVVVGNSNELWSRVSAQAKTELEHILQELMVNMKKHSGAKNVVIKFEQQENQAVILYQDDGVGLGPDFRQGNGLTNTENRINAIGGHIIFDRHSPHGLKLIITFPIAHSK